MGMMNEAHIIKYSIKLARDLSYYGHDIDIFLSRVNVEGVLTRCLQLLVWIILLTLRVSTRIIKPYLETLPHHLYIYSVFSRETKPITYNRQTDRHRFIIRKKHKIMEADNS